VQNLKKTIITKQKQLNELYKNSGTLPEKEWNIQKDRATAELEYCKDALMQELYLHPTIDTELSDLQKKRLWNFCMNQTEYHCIAEIEVRYNQILNIFNEKG
jgi:uncharacterized radical SAM superfamily Fe-S cluster-containing enzyme